MDNYKIEFQSINWENIAKGAKQKVVLFQSQKLRMLRFESDFVEVDWCLNGHIGYVLAGEMELDFGKERIAYTKGDGFIIPKGNAHKHKAIIEKDKFVELILFEDNL